MVWVVENRIESEAWRGMRSRVWTLGLIVGLKHCIVYLNVWWICTPVIEG